MKKYRISSNKKRNFLSKKKELKRFFTTKENLNLLIIAPSENVGVSKASPDGYKEKVSDDGVWNVYYKGELMECFDGKTKPLFNNGNI